MHSLAVFILDANEFRAAGYATLLVPWACRSEADLHVVQALDDIENLSSYHRLACIFCVGGASLRDPEVAGTIESLRDMFGQHPLIVLSDLLESQEIVAAIEAGLRGFLPTTMPPHVALAAMQFVLAGGTYLPHSLEVSRRHAPPAALSSPAGPARLIRRPEASGIAHGAEALQTDIEASSGAATEATLRQRHVEVLAGVSQGHTNKLIARQLNLTEATVKLYVRQLMKIFHAGNRTQLALKASGHPQVESLARSGAGARAGRDFPRTRDEGSACH